MSKKKSFCTKDDCILQYLYTLICNIASVFLVENSSAPLTNMTLVELGRIEKKKHQNVLGVLKGKDFEIVK